MKISFLASSRADLRWFKYYYIRRFPEGRRNADAQYLKALELLLANPFIGHPAGKPEGVREYSIPRTPFSFVYRVRDGAIEVIRVLDGRSEGSNDIQ